MVTPPTLCSHTEATRRRAFALVSQAYTSIIADDFAAFVGLPVEEAVKGMVGLLVAFRESGKWRCLLCVFFREVT